MRYAHGKRMKRSDIMKIALTSRGKDLEAEIDPRFGRCQYFVIVETETMEFTVIDNSAAGASGGAGPQAARSIYDQGAEVLLTGNVGPNAYDALEAAGIKVYTGAGGKIKDAVERYKNGDMAETKSPSVGSHAGMGQGR